MSRHPVDICPTGNLRQAGGPGGKPQRAPRPRWEQERPPQRQEDHTGQDQRRIFFLFD